MASAPGGKTTHIGQLMASKGVLVANDAKADRLPSLIANLTRMGVTCSIVSCLDGRKVPDAMRGFDRILLDAPCTGLGIIARDPSVRANKTKDDVLRMAFLQKQLALAAIDALDADAASKPGGGGILVYSTCSVTVEENEAVVNYLLRKRHVKLLPVFPPEGEDVGRPVRALTTGRGGGGAAWHVGDHPLKARTPPRALPAPAHPPCVASLFGGTACGRAPGAAAVPQRARAHGRVFRSAGTRRSERQPRPLTRASLSSPAHILLPRPRHPVHRV
jgi:hypothetical protein